MNSFQRIAVALERRVEQHDEDVAREKAMREENLRLREDSIRRDDNHRDEELEQARKQQAEIIEMFHIIVARFEKFEKRSEEFASRLLALEALAAEGTAPHD